MVNPSTAGHAVASSAQEFLDWLDADNARHGGDRFDVISPATGQPVASVPDMDAGRALQIVQGNVKAYDSWRRVNAYERSRLLMAWHDAVMASRDGIARIISSEMGKPVAEARGEVAYAAAYIQLYAEEAKRIRGETFDSPSPHKRLSALPIPVGPVYAVTPWNFPAAMITRKVAPALAAGCTAIVKPAEQSPLTAIFLAWLWERVGGPADALSIMTSSDPATVSQVVFSDARVRKFTFTGSTEVGRALYQEAAKTIKRVSLELGGHAPFIVFGDADLEQAVDEVMACKFRNAGQTCVCTNRIYVQRDVMEAFASLLSDRVRALRMGDPSLEETEIGPLVNQDGLDKVRSHVDDALAQGASLHTGGQADGLYFQPTVLADVRAGMKILEEETFGPVAPLIAFDTEAEALEQANATPYGLAAYVYTNDLRRAWRMTEGLEYGIVGLNDGAPSAAQAPFGGIKDSGLGREGGHWGLNEYLDVKYVSLSLKAPQA